MNRSAAREEAFKLLYSLEVQKKEEIEEQIELYLESENITNTEVVRYIKSTIIGIKEKSDVILDKISKNLKSDWKIDRISKIDLVLLKLAIYEILFTDTPYKVAINEVIELSKKYSEENSSNFINGILAPNQGDIYYDGINFYYPVESSSISDSDNWELIFFLNTSVKIS